MLNQRQKLGKKGEELAGTYLEKMGYQVLEQNYRTRLGEIDLIAKHGESIVFVEVKTRRSDSYGSPRLAITPQKQKKLSVAALAYLKSRQKMEAKARFDVVVVKTAGGRPEIEVIQNAFPLCYG